LEARRFPIPLCSFLLCLLTDEKLRPFLRSHRLIPHAALSGVIANTIGPASAMIVASSAAFAGAATLSPPKSGVSRASKPG